MGMLIQEKSPIFRVSSTTKSKAVAGMITATIRSGQRCELQAVGASAINQAIKAIAIARGFLAPTIKELVCTPLFIDVELKDGVKTGMKFIVQAL